MVQLKIEDCRDEILQRTNNGENCGQIASALREKGVHVSGQSISRWRLAWGVRQRPLQATFGRKQLKKRRRQISPNGNPNDELLRKAGRQAERKAEIIARTERGESLEQIAEALQAMGYTFKRRLSTIWRLQSKWGLLHPDARAASGDVQSQHSGGSSLVDGEQQATAPAPHDHAMRAMPFSVQQQQKKQPQQQSNVHDASDRNFGPPQRRSPGDRRHRPDIPADSPSTFSDLEAVPASVSDAHLQPAGVSVPAPNDLLSSVDVATELVSAELLVNLASNTLAWARHLQDLCRARSRHQPTTSADSSSLPFEAEIANAKKKIHEASAVMHDLALSATADAERGQ